MSVSVLRRVRLVRLSISVSKELAASMVTVK
jgi:hypothetical protein